MRYYDFNEVRRGETFTATFWMVDLEDKPINLSAYIAEGQIRTVPEAAGNPVATFSCPAHLDSTGCVTFSLSPTQTMNIDPGLYFYDVRLRNTSNGTIKYVLGGKFRVHKAVTRS